MATTMIDAQYEALLRYAEAGAASLDETAGFLQLRQAIDDANGVTRRVLQVRYQTVPATPQVNPPTPYPPYTTKKIELKRPITRQDVDELLRGVETVSDLVMVTPDPQALVGWTLLEDYDF